MARKKKASPAPQTPFPIFKLPPELRRRIWELVVVTDTPVTVYDRRRSELAKTLQLFPPSLRSGKKRMVEDDQRRAASQLAIAFTCRQAYLEVTPIYYRQNTFYFPKSLRSCRDLECFGLEQFTASISPGVARNITSIIYEFYGYCDPDESLSALTSLESIGFDGIPYHVQVADFHLRKTFDNWETFVRSKAGLKFNINGQMWDPNGKQTIFELACSFYRDFFWDFW